MGDRAADSPPPPPEQKGDTGTGARREGAPAGSSLGSGQPQTDAASSTSLNPKSDQPGPKGDLGLRQNMPSDGRLTPPQIGVANLGLVQTVPRDGSLVPAQSPIYLGTVNAATDSKGKLSGDGGDPSPTTLADKAASPNQPGPLGQPGLPGQALSGLGADGRPQSTVTAIGPDGRALSGGTEADATAPPEPSPEAARPPTTFEQAAASVPATVDLLRSAEAHLTDAQLAQRVAELQTQVGPPVADANQQAQRQLADLNQLQWAREATQLSDQGLRAAYDRAAQQLTAAEAANDVAGAESALRTLDPVYREMVQRSYDSAAQSDITAAVPSAELRQPVKHPESYLAMVAERVGQGVSDTFGNSAVGVALGGLTSAVIRTGEPVAAYTDLLVLAYHFGRDPETFEPAQHTWASELTARLAASAGSDAASAQETVAGVAQAALNLAAVEVPVVGMTLIATQLARAIASGDPKQIGEALAPVLMAPLFHSRGTPETGPGGGSAPSVVETVPPTESVSTAAAELPLIEVARQLVENSTAANDNAGPESEANVQVYTRTGTYGPAQPESVQVGEAPAGQPQLTVVRGSADQGSTQPAGTAAADSRPVAASGSGSGGSGNAGQGAHRTGAGGVPPEMPTSGTYFPEGRGAAHRRAIDLAEQAGASRYSAGSSDDPRSGSRPIPARPTLEGSMPQKEGYVHYRVATERAELSTGHVIEPGDTIVIVEHDRDPTQPPHFHVGRLPRDENPVQHGGWYENLFNGTADEHLAYPLPAGPPAPLHPNYRTDGTAGTPGTQRVSSPGPEGWRLVRETPIPDPADSDWRTWKRK